MNLFRFHPSSRTDTLPCPVLCLLALGLGLALSGCRQSHVPVVSALPSGEAVKPVPAPKPPPRLPKLTGAKLLAQNRVNEAGVVPILEYHTFGESKTDMDRSPKAFRADLNRLWREGYCPVSLHDYLNNRINVPMGKSPVILTFDDSRESQLRFLDDNTVDPDCAMGILLAFHKKHPDFALEATFYVVPDHLFGANSQRVKKLRMLHDLDLELGNHTVTHPTLSKLTDAAVQQEFAGCLARTRKLAPSVIMETIALPKGVFPRNRSLLASGRYQSQKYTHRAVLLGGYCPAQSPVSPRCNPMRLPRIVAHEKHMGITYWLNELKRHPERRYVSDGDPQIITVPKSAAPKVNKKKLRGANLRVY